MVSLCSAHKDKSNGIHFGIEITLSSRDLRSPFDLDLMRSSYTYFDAYQRQDLDGAVFVLAWLVEKLLAKNTLVLMCRDFDFLTHDVTSFFDLT